MKYFHNEMQMKFPCLALAGSTWKSERIGMYIYPQWWRTHGDVEVDAEAEVLDVDVEMLPASTSGSTTHMKRGRSRSPQACGRSPEKAETPK